jgi:minimal PKS acyl carrier protein
MNLSLDEFKEVLRAAAGEAGTLDESPEAVLDTQFSDLGYDSLAVMEVSAQVERRFGITLPEEETSALQTPREYLDYVNTRIAEAA